MFVRFGIEQYYKTLEGYYQDVSAQVKARGVIQSWWCHTCKRSIGLTATTTEWEDCYHYQDDDPLELTTVLYCEDCCPEDSDSCMWCGRMFPNIEAHESECQ